MPAPLIALSALSFPLFWAGGVWLIGQLGWGRLAPRYRAGGTEPDDIRWTRFTSGRVGLGGYSGVLHVGVGAEGLHLRVPLLFRPGHPPLHIPWGEITDVRRHKVLWATRYALRIGTPHAVTVTLSDPVTEAIQEAMATGA